MFKLKQNMSPSPASRPWPSKLDIKGRDLPFFKKEKDLSDFFKFPLQRIKQGHSWVLMSQHQHCGQEIKQLNDTAISPEEPFGVREVKTWEWVSESVASFKFAKSQSFSLLKRSISICLHFNQAALANSRQTKRKENHTTVSASIAVSAIRRTQTFKANQFTWQTIPESPFRDYFLFLSISSVFK